MALELNQSKHRIYEYVESRMSFIAPNLSIIVGASTAAKLMGEEGGFQSWGGLTRAPPTPFPVCVHPAGIAGGLTNLSKMPACNLMLLGAQRRTLSGFSSTSLLPHTGFIYHCDVVQSLPPVCKDTDVGVAQPGDSCLKQLSLSFTGPPEKSSTSGGSEVHAGQPGGQLPRDLGWKGERHDKPKDCSPPHST